MTRWLSDLIVGCVIQVNVNDFLSNQIKPEAGALLCSFLSPLLFLIYVNDLPTSHYKQNSLSQFADDIAQWDFSLNVCFAAKRLQQDLLNLAMWRFKMNPEETKESLRLIARALLSVMILKSLFLYSLFTIRPCLRGWKCFFSGQLNGCF